jgi:hypothetical protein
VRVDPAVMARAETRHEAKVVMMFVPAAVGARRAVVVAVAEVGLTDPGRVSASASMRKAGPCQVKPI